MRKNQNYAGLAQENGFGSEYLHSLQWLVQGTEVMMYICGK
jgi:hypothetical protein